MTAVLPAPSVVSAAPALVSRYFSRKAAPVEWGHRQALLDDHRTGEVVFQMDDVEVPVTWSQNATNILAQKYFRPGETSLRDVTGRVTRWLADKAIAGGYLDAEAAGVLADEVEQLIWHQYASFNSPVWFNIGAPGRRQQSSACFLVDVDDNMESILDWYRTEGLIFAHGSGSGANLSKLRAAGEALSTGGSSSGPVSFMRGADASAGTIKSGGSTRRSAKLVCLDVDHPDIVEFIRCKAKEEKKARVLAAAGFAMDLGGEDCYSLQYQNANNSVRVSDEFMEAVDNDEDWELLGRVDGKVVEKVKAREVWGEIAQAAWECADPGVQYDTTINNWHTCPNTDRIWTSNPCAEFVFLNWTACNLASINLLKFVDEGGFDADRFTRAVRVMTLAQEILVNCDYPTERIGDWTERFRPLGLGFSNLGATLMTLGLPYDSDAGRTVAASITALLTGEAYATSAEIARVVGPFEGWQENHVPMTMVLERHRDEAHKLWSNSVGAAHHVLSYKAQQAWNRALRGAEAYGVRNAQVSVLAPAGTISFLMDCDTTGIEPDLGLVKTKKLADGGTMKIVNHAVPQALANLGYSSDDLKKIVMAINKGVDIRETALEAKHLPVFATSMGTNAIEPMGHVRMMAACQPFLSGAISKTVNCPSETTVGEIADLYRAGWQMGLKSLAVYRDGCKAAQPLATGNGAVSAAQGPQEAAVVISTSPDEDHRVRLERSRPGHTFHFLVDECEGYATTGNYPDGALGELFIRVSKQGSTLGGVMDAFAIAVSLGLQHGVPLATFVRKFSGQKFEPAGMTNDPDVRIAQSIVDYVFRRLALDYLGRDEREGLGVLSREERIVEVVVEQPMITGITLGASGQTAHHTMCLTCGVAMVRAGVCHTCPQCGNTSGCS